MSQPSHFSRGMNSLSVGTVTRLVIPSAPFEPSWQSQIPSGLLTNPHDLGVSWWFGLVLGGDRRAQGWCGRGTAMSLDLPWMLCPVFWGAPWSSDMAPTCFCS